MTVAELVVKIDAETQGLQRGLRDVTDALARLEAKANSSSASSGVTGWAKRAFNGITDVNRGFLGLVSRFTSGIPVIGGLTQNLGALAPVLSGVQVAIAGAGVATVAWVGALTLLFAAAVAVADIIGTLVAIVADLVAPVALVAGLLGGLAAGFFLAAKRAAHGGGALSAFADKLAVLKSMFGKTTDILAHDFLPYLMRLAGAAQTALLFIDKLAKMPLGEAFRTAATQGVQMLSSFLNQVGHVLAHPFRLAIKIAFGAGKGGNEVASAVSSWWTSFTDYLFGYTKSHQLHIGRFLGKMTHTQVDGALQPLIDWFDRHHFAAQGIRIGHELLAGVVAGLKATGLGNYFAQILGDALSTGFHLALKYAFSRGGLMIGGGALAGGGIGLAIGGPIGMALGAAIGATLGAVLNHYWPRIKAAGIHAFEAVGQAVKRFLGPATWTNLSHAATDAWSIIRTVATETIHVIVTVARELWLIFDTLVIKTGLWKVGLGIVKAVIYVISATIRLVLDALRWVVNEVTHLSNIVGGGLLSAFNSVLGVVGSIASGIGSAISAAGSLAGALGNTSGGPPPSYKHPVGRGYTPSVYHPSGTVHHQVNVVLHGPAVIDRAAARRLAQELAPHLNRIVTV